MPLVTASLSLGLVGQFVGRCKEPLCMCDMLHKGGRHVVELHEVAEPLKGFQQDEEPHTRETLSYGASYDTA